MKINRNKGNLQSQLAKMLQAGMENVESEPSTDNQSVSKDVLRANEQAHNNIKEESENAASEQEAENNINKEELNQKAVEAPQPTQKAATRPVARQPRKAATRQSSRNTSPRFRRSLQPEYEAPRLNAAQRHEVPDHNAKYAGEPIKSVGCRMPQSLYARMLQYKAMNDSQLNRITLNDIIIEAVEKFMDENQ